MQLLRWALALITAMAGLAWIFLAIWADGFRRSFGASENPSLVVFGPIVVAGLLLLIFIWPRPWPLRGLGVLAGGGIIGCLWLLREAPFLAGFGLVYCVSALVFMWDGLHR